VCQTPERKELDKERRKGGRGRQESGGTRAEEVKLLTEKGPSFRGRSQEGRGKTIKSEREAFRKFKIFVRLPKKRRILNRSKFTYEK